MNKFIIKTMGCKSNQLEGFLIEQNLVDAGYLKVQKTEDADFFILNSCTVTHKSDNEAFNILHKAKRTNPTIKTVLTGCIAQVEKEKLSKNPDIDIVIGNDEKLELSKYLNNELMVGDIMDLDSFNKILLKDTKKTRASLKIQDGCNNRCSYCIIPFARGKSRSADVDFILDQVKMYEYAGFKEIVLTGIHIGQWGEDFAQRKNLLYLLENIEEKTNISRFRMGSLNPLEIGKDMLEFLKNSEKFCPHFHLSLQSMCDKTLKSMNRHYSVQMALDLIEEIHSNFNKPFLGSDIIAGFVGESEQDFAITLDNLNKSKLTQVHTFPYSIRKNTQAEAMEGHLNDKTKTKRASLIKEGSARKYQEFLQSNIGSTQEVLIEKNFDKKTGKLKGVTRNYLNVLIETHDDKIIEKNALYKVNIVSIDGCLLSGKVIY